MNKNISNGKIEAQKCMTNEKRIVSKLGWKKTSDPVAYFLSPLCNFSPKDAPAAWVTTRPEVKLKIKKKGK